jgi:hypothetical protein
VNSDEWYSYKEFNFTRPQTYWAIQNLSTLEQGEWPSEPVETGYTESPIGITSVRAEGNFVKPAIIASEIDVRLKGCGIAGELLLVEAKHDTEMYYLTSTSRLALNYCSGWKRRKESFSKFRATRVYRSKRAAG